MKELLTNIAVGMSGVQVRNAINGNFNLTASDGVYNALVYDVVNDGITDTTTELQDLLDLVHVTGGVIYLPTGTYLLRTITLYCNVTLIGDYRTTILKSNNAEALLTISTEFGGLILRNIVLDGNYTGTVGLYMQQVASFSIIDCAVQRFTDCGIDLNGSLVGVIERTYIYLNTIGINGRKYEVNAVSANLVEIKNCGIRNCSTYGIKWNGGSHLRVVGCDMENNGTLGNASTGAIYYKDWESGTGLFLDSCWFEVNNGICVTIDDNNVIGHVNSIHDCLFYGNIVNGTHADIKIIGSTRYNRLIIKSSFLQDPISIIISGALSSVVSIGSILYNAPTIESDGIYTNAIDVTGLISPVLLSSAPDSPVEGNIYANSSDHHLYYYNGTEWKQLDN